MVEPVRYSAEVVCSISDEAIEFFQFIQYSSSIAASGVDSACNRNEYQEFSGG
jgi:hypothetical protein